MLIYYLDFPSEFVTEIDLGITESFLSNISTGQGFHLFHMSVQVIYSQITYKCIQVVYIQIIYKLYSYMHTEAHRHTLSLLY